MCTVVCIACVYAEAVSGCEGDGNVGVGNGGGVVVVSAGHVSGNVSSAANVLWMRGVGVVCEMCMCFAQGGMERRVSG